MQTTFAPPRQSGLIFHFSLLLFLVFGSLASIYSANQAEARSSFLVSIAGLLIFTLPIPFLAYRAYGLWRSNYQLSPDGIRLSWGLRYELIPIDDILWMCMETDLESPLPIPFLQWPGSVLGSRRIGKGEVEYLAVRSRGLVVIATSKKLYAISPIDPEKFIKTFNRLAEKGAVNPILGQSLSPTFLFEDVWAHRPARSIILLGLFLSFTFLAWIFLFFSSESNPISSKYSQTQILLLPIFNTLFFLINLFFGLFFYRREESKPLAFILWGTSILTSLLFFIVLI